MNSFTIVLAHASPEPLYRQIEEQIRAAVVSGEIGEGEELPSIRRLAQDLRTSVITVKRAYDELELQGFLDTVPGKGCYASVRNKEAFREERLRMIDRKLDEVVADARSIGLGLGELQSILKILYGEEDNGNLAGG